MKLLWRKLKEQWIWFTSKAVLEAINDDRPFEEVKAIVMMELYKKETYKAYKKEARKKK